MDSQPCDTGSTWLSEHRPSPVAESASTISIAALRIAPPIEGISAAQPSRRQRDGCAYDQTAKRMASLRAAWVAHTVKRALAAVGSASDQDYRAIGWDRGELLAKLRWHRDRLGDTNTSSLAIVISRPG